MIVSAWNRKSSTWYDVWNDGSWAAAHTRAELRSGSSWYCNAGWSKSKNWWCGTANHISK